MSKHLIKNQKEENLLLAPRPLQLSLATLSTMAKDGSITKNQLIGILGCNFFNNCSFLMNGTMDDFGFFTNIQMDMNARQISSSNHLTDFWKYLDHWNDEQLTTLEEVVIIIFKIIFCHLFIH